MDNSKGRFGYFDTRNPGSYVCTSINMAVPWEYVYHNGDILLKVDQSGPVTSQVKPLKDIVLFKREGGEAFSKWGFWIKGESFNNGLPLNSFFRPLSESDPLAEPDVTRITFNPHCAEYYYEYRGLALKTVLTLPRKGADIVMKTEIMNLSDSPISLQAISYFIPYVNRAILDPWDKPEWYLHSGLGKEEELVFWTRLLNPESDSEKRRAVTMWCSAEDADSFEISLEKFCGPGGAYNPAAAHGGSLSLDLDECSGFGEYTGGNSLWFFPPVYALNYNFKLKGKGKREFTQVLSLLLLGVDSALPGKDAAKKPLRFFNDGSYLAETEDVRIAYADIFAKRSLSTNDKFFDYYVNTWLPLQMHWVTTLDRGWPTGMRGTRDCSNDFLGALYLYPEWTKEILRLLFSCQRKDGWFPRQVSEDGPLGRHDLRPYVDGGVFVIELLYEYLCFTGDFGFLDEEHPWLDDGSTAKVIDHALEAVRYYLAADNIGEHGLCKIRGGDWLDGVNRAGLEGRGESVMVTEQLILAISQLEKIADAAGAALPGRAERQNARSLFARNLSEHALNGKGFFNGVFTDGGKWVFSDSDPDGRNRVYIPSNAYAIISGVAEGKLAKDIIAHIETLKSPSGYRLFWPPLGETPIDKVGRIASGDQLPGASENGNPYNHGSHGFLCRALAVAGEGDKLFEVLQYMLPYDQEKHPTEQALTPPYAVVNKWSAVPGFMHRGGSSFLTGTIGMAVRTVYNWMLGIKQEPDGLIIDPCVPSHLGEISADFEIRGKKLKMTILDTGSASTSPERLVLNNAEVKTRRKDIFSGREAFFMPYGSLADGDEIAVQMRT